MWVAVVHNRFRRSRSEPGASCAEVRGAENRCKEDYHGSVFEKGETRLRATER
jgi:hypothetical protein